MDLKPYLNRWTVFGAIAVAGILLIITLIIIGWTSPRFTAPYLISWFITTFIMFAGIAKPMPMLPPM